MTATPEQSAVELAAESHAPADPAPSVIDADALRARLDAACAEGIGPNIDRWLAFAGIRSGDVVEVAALDVPEGRGFEAIYTARCTSSAKVKRLLARGPKAAPGLYVLRNVPFPEIAAQKGGADEWLKAGKGDRPTDNQVALCTSLYLDVDPVRPANLKISATEGERAAAWTRALDVLSTLTAAGVPLDAIGIGDSGNGTALYVACARLPETAELHAARITICAALDALHGDERVKIDSTAANAARLHPAYGTTKRKGADTAERRHRPTGFLAFGDTDAARLRTLAEVQALAATLAARAGIDASATSTTGSTKGARKPASSASTRGTRSSATKPSDRYRAVKDACTIEEVVSHLGVALDRLLAARPGRAYALVPGGRTGDEEPITPGRHIARRVLASAGSLALVQGLDLARELVRYLPARDVIGRGGDEGRAAPSNGG